MPIYKVKCDSCGDVSEIFRTVRDYDETPICCGVKTYRLISAPYVMGDIPAYRSMQTGEYVDGRAKHRDHLKRHGLIEVGNEKPKPRAPVKLGGVKEDIARAVNKVLG